MESNIQLHEGENILFEAQPNLKWVWCLFLKGILFFLPIGIGLCIVMYHSPVFTTTQRTIIAMLFVGFYFGGLAWSLTLVYLRLKRTRYIITTDRCIKVSSLLGVNKETIPLSKIIDVNLSQDFFAVRYGLASVSVQVSGSNQESFQGLLFADAEKLIELLNENIRKA